MLLMALTGPRRRSLLSTSLRSMRKMHAAKPLRPMLKPSATTPCAGVAAPPLVTRATLGGKRTTTCNLLPTIICLCTSRIGICACAAPSRPRPSSPSSEATQPSPLRRRTEALPKSPSTVGPTVVAMRRALRLSLCAAGRSLITFTPSPPPPPTLRLVTYRPAPQRRGQSAPPSRLTPREGIGARRPPAAALVQRMAGAFGLKQRPKRRPKMCGRAACRSWSPIARHTATIATPSASPRGLLGAMSAPTCGSAMSCGAARRIIAQALTAAGRAAVGPAFVC